MVGGHPSCPPAPLLDAARPLPRRPGVEAETFIRGRRGAYLLVAPIALSGHEQREWSVVADVGRDAASVAELIRLLKSDADLRAELDEDIRLGTRNLIRIVASIDGLQLTGDELASWRHFSNALFNAMRGGVPGGGYEISSSDLRSYLRSASQAVSARDAGAPRGAPPGAPAPQPARAAGCRGGW